MGFVSMVARLMPQKIEVSTPTDGMSDERLADMLELAAAIREGRVIEGGATAVAPPLLAHRPADEIGSSHVPAEEGGGGPDRAHLLGGVNTPHTIAPQRAETAASSVAKHNELEGADVLSPPDSQNATLPYPVGRPFPKPDHVVERENRAKIAEAEADIDPASLF